MRASAFVAFGILTLVCSASPGVAQGDPSGASPSSGRVGSLSPGEAKRAARARERAASRARTIETTTSARDAKPTDVKPTDAKPTDAKPTDAKTTDTKTTRASEPTPSEVAPRTQASAKLVVGHKPSASRDAARSAPRRSFVRARPAHVPEPQAAEASEPRRIRRSARHFYAAGSGRFPRVGDTVPLGVPLYPMPPGAGPPPGYYDRAEEP